MRGFPERWPLQRAPHFFLAHEPPSFTRLDCSNHRPRSIDGAGVDASVVATVARCTASRASPRRRDLSATSLRRWNQKDWQEGQFLMNAQHLLPRALHAPSLNDRAMSGSVGKADTAPIAGAPVLVNTKRLGRVGRLSSTGGYASCDLASSISRAACAQDDPSFIRYARNSGSLSVSANRTHSPARFRHSCGSLTMATSCND